MLKIVEVHESQNPDSEYLVLQNLGLVTISLRGWALCTDAYLEGDTNRVAQEMYIFREDVAIKPYTRVVLFTGQGQTEWVPTIDGKQAYCVCWGRSNPVWWQSGNIYVLHVSGARRLYQPAPAAEMLSTSA